MIKFLAILSLLVSTGIFLEAASIDGTVLKDKVVTLKHFSFVDCGPNDPIKVDTVNVTPDPIKIPGNITATVHGSTSVEVNKAATIHLTLKKSIAGVIITIPCIDNIGSCDYNLCALMDAYFTPGVPCIPGFPCHCPIPSGSYSLDNFMVSVPIKLPDIVNGDLYVSATLNTDSELACVNGTVTLST